MKRDSGDGGEAGGAGVALQSHPVVERFSIPRQHDGLVQRSRLLEHLDRGVAGPLTLVSAPAGTGKTVLVSAWASRAQSQHPVVWVTLETEDESRPRFWSTLAQGLRRCGVFVDLPPFQTDKSQGDSVYVDAMVAALLDREEQRRSAQQRSAQQRSAQQRSAQQQHSAQPRDTARQQQPEPLVVVLDCEAGMSAAVAEDLDSLLRRSGDLVRLVIVTRADPALPLHRYRLTGAIAEVRMADLAFTLDEARELMTKAGVLLSEAALRTILDRTHGWAAGLRFAAGSLDNQGDQDRTALDFRGDTGDVAEYLIAEVLDTKPADRRQVLLETSILDVLRPGLSEAVAGPQVQRVLAGLARGNAFLDVLADSPSSYSYQPLFREMLRAQLAYEMPGRVPGLHRAAAAWMADHGLVEDAVRHSEAAADWEGAARYVINDLAIGRLLWPGGGALVDVLSRLPDTTQGAAASLVRAALAMSVFDVEACAEYLLRASRQLNGSRAPHWSAGALALQMVRLNHLVTMGDAEQALGAAASAERLMQMQANERLDQHPELTVLIESARGAALLAIGELEEAGKAFSAGAHRATDQPGCEQSLVGCLGHLALIAAMRGQLRRAGDLAEQVATAQPEASPRLDASPSAAVALAWVNIELYDLPSARRHAQRAGELMSTAHDSTTAVMLALVEARARRARGDVEGALARVAEVPAEVPTEAPTPTRWLQDTLRVEEAELTVSNGQPARAVQILEGLSRPLSPEGVLAMARARMATGTMFDSPVTTLRSTAVSLPTRVGSWLLEATHRLDCGDELEAVDALQRSLRLAAPERLRRPFREASHQVRRLLRGEPQLTAQHGWLGASTLDDARPFSPPRRATPSGDGGARHVAGPLVEPLTEKEREVLGHLAALLTTDEIAGAMFVSVNTIRTHVRNVLRKLAASRRNEAVRRARELGILDGWGPSERAVEPIKVPRRAQLPSQ